MMIVVLYKDQLGGRRRNPVGWGGGAVHWCTLAEGAPARRLKPEGQVPHPGPRGYSAGHGPREKRMWGRVARHLIMIMGARRDDGPARLRARARASARGDWRG